MPSGPHPSSRTPRSQLHPRSAKGPAREVTVHLGEVISTVHIYVTPADAPRKAGKGRPIRGLVSFETSAKQKFVANLLECWIPAGTWKLRPSKKREAGSDVEVLAPQLELLWAQDPEAARAAGRAAVANGVLWLSQPDSDADLKTLGRLFENSAESGQPILLIVSYARGEYANASSRKKVQSLTEAHAHVLLDEQVAEIYLQFLEHFGDVRVNHILARGGLTQQKLVAAHKNVRRLVELTNLFTQGYAEFQASRGKVSPALELENFRAMEESIFYQRKFGNDLAKRNMLEIGAGWLMYDAPNYTKAFKDDVGVRQRGGYANSPLLYDRYGEAVHGFQGYLDLEYHDIAPGVFGLTIPVALDSDSGIYSVLQAIRQQGFEPTAASAEAVASLIKHWKYITAEVHGRFYPELSKQICQMLPWAVGFFVAHAIAAELARRGNVIAVLFMVALIAAGALMGFDYFLLNAKEMKEAGHHFARLEMLHRQAGDKEARLTALSMSHLTLGTNALIKGAAGFISMGLLAVGGKLVGSKMGNALREGLEKPRQSARAKIIFDEEGNAARIESTDPKAPQQGSSGEGKQGTLSVKPSSSESSAGEASGPPASGSAPASVDAAPAIGSSAVPSPAPAGAASPSAGQDAAGAATGTAQTGAPGSAGDGLINEPNAHLNQGARGRTPKPGPRTEGAPAPRVFPRTPEELEALASDPAHGGEVTPKSLQERAIGLELEQQGVLEGPITRDPTGSAEFIDANGQKWDIKGPNSSFPPKKGGFKLEKDLAKIGDELDRGENVIVDTSKMSNKDLNALQAGVEEKGWSDRVVWWP